MSEATEFCGDECVSEPPPPTGACCIEDDSCVVGTEAGCEGEGGVYQDDDSVCEPNPCVEPPSGPTVIIPTMGQWGMIIASVILGFFAIIRLRRIKDLEL